MILFCYFCGFCCLFCFVFLTWHLLLGFPDGSDQFQCLGKFNPNSQDRSMDLMGLLRLPLFQWWFNGPGTFVESSYSYKFVFFPRFSKKSPDSHPPSPKLQKIIKPRCRDWTWNSSVCDRKEWDPLENSGHKGSQGLWPMQWPEASGLKKKLPGSFSSKLPLKL